MISDQLFWIISVLLVVEILSQLFQFESLGKVFVQFYILAIHALVGITLASFETRELVYFFVVLIAFVNSFRFFMYKLPILNQRGSRRFVFDFITILALMGLMYVVDPFLSFSNVPSYSNIVQYSVIGSLALVLTYEMLQRANQTGIHLDDYLPRSAASFFLVLLSIATGIGILVSGYLGLNLATKSLALIIYLFIIIVLNGLIQARARDGEFYAILYVLPTLVALIAFIQIIIIGG